MTDPNRGPETTTRPSEATRTEEEQDALRHAGPDREPTPEELKLAEDLELDPEVARNYKEMTERGADQQGEGRVP